MKKIVFSICFLPSIALAQEKIDSAMNARIRDEGFNHSKVLETATILSDGFGPRLAGSEGWKKAAAWAQDRLRSFGAKNVHLEPWGKRGKGWELDGYSIEMTAPYYLNVYAMPNAWAPSIKGKITGTPVLISIRGDSDFVKYRGKLRGKIVMNGRPAPIRGRFEPLARRFTDKYLDSLANLTEPGDPKNYWEDIDSWAESMKQRNAIIDFYRQEGVAAVLTGSNNSNALSTSSFLGYSTDRSKAVPTFVLSKDHFSRIFHLLEQNPSQVKLSLSLRTHYTHNDSLGYNVIGEIPGTDPSLATEVVMLGGHFDSWQAGTGATDDGAGCAVGIEVLRILSAVGAKPRRTIRLAMWDGEEQEDYFGSGNYVVNHFGYPMTMLLKPEHAKLSAYYNLDTGTGKIRGVNLMGNSGARPILAAFLAPFADLGAATVSIRNDEGTDMVPFWGVGLPAFNFIQDPIDYETRTHHTNLDIADYLIEDDLKQAAVVMASVVYHTAMRDERMPRSPLPPPRK
jgi:hypothetical protein